MTHSAMATAAAGPHPSPPPEGEGAKRVTTVSAVIAESLIEAVIDELRGQLGLAPQPPSLHMSFTVGQYIGHTAPNRSDDDLAGRHPRQPRVCLFASRTCFPMEYR